MYVPSSSIMVTVPMLTFNDAPGKDVMMLAVKLKISSASTMSSSRICTSVHSLAPEPEPMGKVRVAIKS